MVVIKSKFTLLSKRDDNELLSLVNTILYVFLPVSLCNSGLVVVVGNLMVGEHEFESSEGRITRLVSTIPKRERGFSTSCIPFSKLIEDSKLSFLEDAKVLLGPVSCEDTKLDEIFTLSILDDE